MDLLRKIAGSKSDPMTICQMLGIQTHELGEKTYQHIGTCENFEEDGIDKPCPQHKILTFNEHSEVVQVTKVQREKCGSYLKLTRSIISQAIEKTLAPYEVSLFSRWPDNMVKLKRQNLLPGDQ